MSMSLDGFNAEPNDEPAGLDDWFFSPPGGRTERNREVMDESVRTTGAIVTGRRACDQGDNVDGFVDSPYEVEHFVPTHDVPEKVAKGEMTFTFVTDGIESALEQAEAAAGDRNVAVGGGARIAQQCIRAGLLDEIQFTWCPYYSAKASGCSSIWAPSISNWNEPG
jgi:dihydrofolate reductase